MYVGLGQFALIRDKLLSILYCKTYNYLALLNNTIMDKKVVTHKLILPGTKSDGMKMVLADARFSKIEGK